MKINNNDKPSKEPASAKANEKKKDNPKFSVCVGGVPTYLLVCLCLLLSFLIPSTVAVL